MTWTREHDKTLAEKCDGFNVEMHMGQPCVHERGDRECLFPVEFYDENMHAVVRAADRWRKAAPPGERDWMVKMGQECYWGKCRYNKTLVTYEEVGKSAAEALAWALYKAVTK